MSLTIGTKSAPSSPRSGGRKTYNNYSNYNDGDATDSGETKKNTNVPSGQGYMQKLVGSLNELDDDNDNRMGMFFVSFYISHNDYC